MKRIRLCLGIALVAILAACTPRERTLVVLSTNDMHAKIQNFPRLAAAVEACRDTTQLCLLVDAGDRWTGNAYVDMASTPGMPIIALMNRLGYDIATLGNHEFDHGQAHLGQLIDSMDFKVVCANVHSDTTTFPHLRPYEILSLGGLKIGVIGAVTNYENNGFPAGTPENFEGISFTEPQAEVAKYAAVLRDSCDLVMLVSHMGDDRDLELLSGKNSEVDLVIGGHTHVVVDTLVGPTLLTQTGKYLNNVGVTKIRIDGSNRIQGIDFELVPLEKYSEEPEYRTIVDGFCANAELNRPVGEMVETASKVGLANWMAGSIRKAARADLGFYHIGGVRLDSLSGGGVSMARLFDLEPFSSRVVVVELTRDELKKIIIDKFNDLENRKEAHRVDLYSPAEYVIVTDSAGDAVDVRGLKQMKPGRSYRVALPDYVYKNYAGIDRGKGTMTEIKVSRLLEENLRAEKRLHPDNVAHQRIEQAR